MKTFTVDLTLSIDAMTQESADNKLDSFLSALDLKKNEKLDLVSCGELAEGESDGQDDEEDSEEDAPDDTDDPLSSILDDINSEPDAPTSTDDDDEDWEDWE